MTYPGVGLSIGINRIFIALLFGIAVAEQGYITVETDRPGLSIFLDSEFIGRSPIEKRPTIAGEHTVSLFHPDTIENGYWRAREQGVLGMITRLPSLRRYDVGTRRVVVNPNETVKVFLSYVETERAPSKTYCLIGGCTGGVIGGSFLLGFIIAWLISH